MCSAEAVWLAAETAAALQRHAVEPDRVARLAGEVGVLGEGGAPARHDGEARTLRRRHRDDDRDRVPREGDVADFAVEPEALVGSLDSRRRAAAHRRIVELRQRERAGVSFEPARGEEAARDHAVGQRCRRRRRPCDAQDRRRVVAAHAGAALLLRHQREIEAAVFDRLPELLWKAAGFGGVDHVLGDGGLEDRPRRGDQQVADLAHRRPNPRAMMPRRISVVPPWMV